MKKVAFEAKTSIAFENVYGFFRKKVTKFGTGAKVDCPKDVCVVVMNKSQAS